MDLIDEYEDGMAPREILEYLSNKYETQNIVDRKTIYNWLEKMGITYITDPMPSRRADYRYYKSDVLKMELENRQTLLRKRELSMKFKTLENKGKDAVKERLDETKNDVKKSLKREEDNRVLSKFEHAKIVRANAIEEKANTIIRDEMLEMCFKKLFPNFYFDKEELKKQLNIVEGITYSGKPSELGEAIDYVKNRKFFKKK